MTQTHTFLVAIEVEADDDLTRADAERYLHGRLPDRGGITPLTVASWWIAEDDRLDGSDNDSAIFVPKGEASLSEMERELLLMDFDAYGSELIDRVEQIIADRMGRRT